MKHRILAFLMAIYLACNVIAAPASAGQSSCPQFYTGGVAPDLINEQLSPKTRELCNEVYAVLHSGLTRTPLYAAEHMTRENLQRAKGLPRTNSFRPDLRLPADERAELHDYARSGYDRGHQYCAGDAYTASGKDGSFLLSNMVPQDPDNNRILWEGIESATRTEAKRRGELYVITGPLFQGNQLKSLHGRVMIPTGLFKAIYDPARGEAAAYIAANAPGMDYRVISIAALEEMTGINLFPALSSQVKNRSMRLPVPRPYRQSHGGGAE
jgi:endonuclease G